MLENMTKKKAIVIIVISALLLILIYLAAIAYVLLIRPSYGLRYANIFFMISFTVIFFSLVYIYHIWISRIQERED